MFRVVKTPEGGSAFFLMCDHRQCMDARRGDAIVVNVEEYRLTRKAFIKAAIDEGWWVDLEGGFCPFHSRELQHAARAAEANGKQVVEARPEHVAAFGKVRPQ